MMIEMMKDQNPTIQKTNSPTMNSQNGADIQNQYHLTLKMKLDAKTQSQDHQNSWIDILFDAWPR